ncbi:MAG: Uncharacterised protein [SAR116 cluster bacterium]|nr:MAG: Uncharacterised protein [SAR116 cluster bacterium]
MLVDYRRADHAISTEQDGNFFLVHNCRNFTKIHVHDFGHASRPLVAEQFAKPHLTNWVTGRVDHKKQIEFGVLKAGAAKIVNRLAHRPEGRHGHQLALHHPAGRILWIGQTFLDKDAVLGRQGSKDIINVALLEFFDDIHRVIGR